MINPFITVQGHNCVHVVSTGVCTLLGTFANHEFSQHLCCKMSRVPVPNLEACVREGIVLFFFLFRLGIVSFSAFMSGCFCFSSFLTSLLFCFFAFPLLCLFCCFSLLCFASLLFCFCAFFKYPIVSSKVTLIINESIRPRPTKNNS